MFRGLAAMLLMLSLISCDSSPRKVIFNIESPDGKHVARLAVSEEGTLGSTRYRLDLAETRKPEFKTVFKGENGDVAAPVWDGPSSIIIPFCFGSITSVESVTQFTSGAAVTFRGRTSSQIRVHVVTSPDTDISGRRYCAR
ncbi:hypothetical protein FJQ54_04810 [Sandaracinobacter neustonicus]|uniref:Uncharacterized protein n=1 Tax=Sandaracinobacter neustonicus TaxID=1715348 RepID=A0A501XQU6_9SPHN|nr:hypothetical protein [Sandaracinobacter neustonicus]TPE62845.1 hypothetical protein FJQ54_04810 [Sandaracinobacter neustonicus]